MQRGGVQRGGEGGGAVGPRSALRTALSVQVLQEVVVLVRVEQESAVVSSEGVFEGGGRGGGRGGASAFARAVGAEGVRGGVRGGRDEGVGRGGADRTERLRGRVRSGGRGRVCGGVRGEAVAVGLSRAVAAGQQGGAVGGAEAAAAAAESTQTERRLIETERAPDTAAAVITAVARVVVVAGDRGGGASRCVERVFLAVFPGHLRQSAKGFMQTVEATQLHDLFLRCLAQDVASVGRWFRMLRRGRSSGRGGVGDSYFAHVAITQSLEEGALFALSTSDVGVESGVRGFVVLIVRRQTQFQTLHRTNRTACRGEIALDRALQTSFEI